MKLSFAILAGILPAASFGSTITYSTPATQNSSTYTVAVSSFSTTGSDMTGIQISAYLNGSSTASTCTLTPCAMPRGSWPVPQPALRNSTLSLFLR